jgi:hypothetical protein
MSWHEEDIERSRDSRPRSPESELLRVLGRLRGDAAELNELLDAGPELLAAWRASFTNDAVDYTVDRIGDDGTAWFAWWSFLLEQGSRPTLAIVSNLDALGGIDTTAPGHLEGLLQRLTTGRTALRLLVPPEARIGSTAVVMSMLHDAGVRLRVGDVSGWFAVAPGRAALVPTVWGRDRDVDAMVLHTPSMLAALEQLFLLRWEAAAPWTAGSRRPDPVIELLCLGRSDAQIAGQLGISIRSVRRRVAETLQRTGAATRMQLGYRLGRAGGDPPVELVDTGD